MSTAAGPVCNPLDDLVGYQLRRMSNGLMADLASSLSEIGLRPTEASILTLIAANPGVTQSEIGSVLGIKRANMAPLTAVLDRRGLILRRRVDGRSHGLAVSDDGAELSRRAMAAMRSHDARFLAQLTDAARAGLSDALILLRRAQSSDCR